MFKLRQRSCLLLTTVFVLAPCIVVLLIMGPELSTNQSISQRLVECHMRLQHLESMYRTRQEDVAILSKYLEIVRHNGQVLKAPASVSMLGSPNNEFALNWQKRNLISKTTLSTNNKDKDFTSTHWENELATVDSARQIPFTNLSFDDTSRLLDLLSPESQQMLKNVSHLSNPESLATINSIRLPSAYHFLPHLLDDPNSLRPAYLQSKGRTDISIVLGIPTVKRHKQSYLLGTLQNLIDNMNESEQNETLIVVYIGETDISIVQFIAKRIEMNFKTYLDNGLIDIIAPSPSYYPNFETLRITLNDSLERIKWRSKQNLDFSYLMAYAQSKGTFYVQLEDDILAKPNFLTLMKKFAITKSSVTTWWVLDFCQLGFIGKMFKSAELPYLITFIHMFYNDKPVDWLLTYFIDSKVCRTDKDQKHCNLEKAKYWLHYRPSLFQHIGTSSSLKGKVQKLKDKQFGWKVPSFFVHPNNPAALVKSNIVPYKNYLLKRAYRGETYFWGLLPQPDDLVQFIFEKPTHLRSYLFRSGNSEHPSDRFYNTTVEVMPADNTNKNLSVSCLYNTTSDGFLILGSFNVMGVAEGSIDPQIGAIKEMRLHVHSDSENWVLLSEIDLQEINPEKTHDNKNRSFTNS